MFQLEFLEFFQVHDAWKRENQLKNTSVSQPDNAVLKLRSNPTHHNFAYSGFIFLKACFTPKSAIIASTPPKIVTYLTCWKILETSAPCPVCVSPRPPMSCTASLATLSKVRAA